MLPIIWYSEKSDDPLLSSKIVSREFWNQFNNNTFLSKPIHEKR
jgi:hypothetical protein